MPGLEVFGSTLCEEVLICVRKVLLENSDGCIECASHVAFNSAKRHTQFYRRHKTIREDAVIVREYFMPNQKHLNQLVVSTAVECFAFPALFAVGTLVITQLGEFQAWEALGINLPRNLAVELFKQAVGVCK